MLSFFCPQNLFTSHRVHWRCTPSATTAPMCWRDTQGWRCLWPSLVCIRRQDLTRRKEKVTTPRCGLRCGKRTFQVRSTAKQKKKQMHLRSSGDFWYFILVNGHQNIPRGEPFSYWTHELFFAIRKLWGYQTLHDGADHHHPESPAVPVLEDEGSGGSCHGNCCQGTDRLIGGAAPRLGADSFDAGVVWTHVGRQGNDCWDN